MSAITIPIEFELSPRSRAVMDALSRALDPKFVSADESTAEPAGDPIAHSLAAPVAAGAFWPEHDAWYAGLQMTPGGRYWHALVPKEHINTLTDVKWGGYGTQIEGAADMYDGLANTQAMSTAGLELAQRVQALGKGMYLPSRAEVLLMFATLKSVIGDGVVWTSTQYSANNAWCQFFYYGDQGTNSKGCEFRAVPVRRLFL
ncbi:hypothetical protein KIH07_16960 [Hydrogenophaga taeniospiralis]|uniref:DUF1566 domain-containing protein n=1 Tax=Hydrogenophaga taeniospiralis TaxID=65656 RepID=UPI001CF9C1CA|nr:DUF1566 domain-containing protein [Hydrogenophaga taeniospiralis]MCB4365436.1 hypothetical protein [Hydrogenophaga taeniospiralis]